MWWWLNSNVSEGGITRDLEEMKRQGIGGALIFDASPVDRWQHEDVARVPVGPPFMSSRWREFFRHALIEADRLGIELGVSLTSGFNAGGPWVTPEYGQQELVWAELIVDGPKRFAEQLPLPAGEIYGDDGEPLHYQEFEINNELARDTSGRPVHFQDVAVIAVPISEMNEIVASKDVLPGRPKNWALKSIKSFDYPEDKGYRFETVYDDAPDIEGERIFHSDRIIDLTDRMNEEGKLRWRVPEGRWLVVRFGHTHTGVTLQATNPNNKGLAMNHLGIEAAQRHFEEIGREMIEDIRTTGTHSLKYFYLDSWEVRVANWTSGFREIFRDRRGYDMTPYLPVLTGRIVDSREVSNRFLHDYRETVGDCIADHYYGAFRDMCHSHGLEFRAEMATTPIPVDMLKCLGRCDVPFGEFWAESSTGTGRDEPWERMFGKQAASSAHTYGSRYVAAEALTVIGNHWEYGPFQLKRTVDQAFCSGLNSLMVHTFTHSPPDVGLPGFEYFAGTHFNPQITWWNQADAFTEYMGRCQSLLQAGHFIADVCFYQGGGIPNFVPMKQSDPRLGPGYDYDVINTEALLTRLNFEDGRLVLPDGMSYRVLVLPETDRIRLDVLQKIEDLVRKGATVVGPRPARTYGLNDFPERDRQVNEIADRLWGDSSEGPVKEREYGKGRIIWGKTAREVLLEDGFPPDFEYRSDSDDVRLDYIHRSISGEYGVEIYFVTNLRNRLERVDCTFRVKDRTPEIWDSATGETRLVVVYDIQKDRICLPLILPPLGSVFVVFNQGALKSHLISFTASEDAGFGQEILFEDDRFVLWANAPGVYTVTTDEGRSQDVEITDCPSPLPVAGPWTISFPEGWGAPNSVQYEKLAPWTESENPGIKYFSGTATYTATFDVDASMISDEFTLNLDLGDVKEIAEVRLNGVDLGILWNPPFMVDVTSVSKPGVNRLDIGVTNLWPNRLIGDQFLPVEDRFTYTNIKGFTKESHLFESGLLGPVRVVVYKKVPLKI